MSVTQVSTGVIADSSVTSGKLASGAARANWGAGGVLQVVQTVKSDTFSTTSASFTDITGLSVTITPSSASSKILIRAIIMFASDATTPAYIPVKLLRGSTGIGLGDASGGNPIQATSYAYPGVNNDAIWPCVIEYLDSPNTTSATTYKIQVLSGYNTRTFYVNRSINDNQTYDARVISVITATEISG